MDNPGFNTFNNDGSFMEKFMKMQEEKKKKEEEEDKSTPPTPKTATPSLVKRKPLIMKMRGLKKAPTLVKSSKTLSTLEGNSSDNNKEEQEQDKTKEAEPGIPLASSIISRGMASGDANEGFMPQESGTPTAQLAGKKRKRRSRWSDAPPSATQLSTSASGGTANSTDDDALIANAMASFIEQSSFPGPQYGGQASTGQKLSQEQLQQIKEQVAMNKLVAEIRLATERSVQKKKTDPSKPVVHEYDSDEDTEGGTWEHKLRAQEMLKTLEKARELTEQGKGKHHIGDFLPPQELEKFIEKARAIKEGRDPDLSDYKEHKLDASNIGFRMLQKAGWSEGEGLGEKQDGITAPINQGKQSFDLAGVGSAEGGEVSKDDDPFDTYRKRMMLAYRFRPNPLNNPRRPYY